MIEYKIYQDRNDPDFIANCGERKTDEYLFDLAGYLFACVFLAVSYDQKKLAEICLKLKRLKAQKGVSGILWLVSEKNFSEKSLAEVVIQTIQERNRIDSDFEQLLFYNHLWCSAVSRLIELCGDNGITADVVGRLASILPAEEVMCASWYPYSALRDVMTVYLNEGRARMRLLLILRAMTCKNNGCLVLGPFGIEDQIKKEYDFDYTDNCFKRTWVQFTGKSPYAQRKKLHEIVERLGGGAISGKGKTDLLVCCSDGSSQYSGEGIGSKILKAMMPGSGALVIQEEEFWLEVERVSGVSRDELLES